MISEKPLDHEMEGSHVEIGVDVANTREHEVVIDAIQSHHGDVRGPKASLLALCRLLMPFRRCKTRRTP